MYRTQRFYWLGLGILLIIAACNATETVSPTIESTDSMITSAPEIQVTESQPDMQENSLVGTWTEVAQISCQSKSERSVANAIEELVFFEDDTINVTWFAFETYVDYIGTYALDAEGGIEIVAEKLNYLPSELDTSGSYEFDEHGRLLLMDMWLGVPPLDSPHPINCGHIFEMR